MKCNFLRQVPLSILGLTLIMVSRIHCAPTSENPTAIVLFTGNSNGTSNINMTHVMERVGRFLGISLALGLGDGIGLGGYPYGQSYPCNVYGYPAPYAPPGSFPCGNPYLANPLWG